MSTTTKTYELANDQGCHCDETKATSMESAKEFFASKWSGDFRIICGESNEEINVTLD